MIKIKSDNFDIVEINKNQSALCKASIDKLNKVPMKKKMLERLFKIFSKNKKSFKIENFIRDMVNLDENLLTNNDYYINEYVMSCEMMFKLYSVTTRKNREYALNELINKSQIFNISVFIPQVKDVTEKDIFENIIKNNKDFKSYLNKKLFKKLIHVNNYLSKVFSYKAHIYPIRDDILKAMKITVCPYCNETLLHTKSEKYKKTIADLDHFFVQSYFPLLALSFGNFVPSCSGCNRTLKGQSISDLSNPRIEEFGSLAYFKTDVSHADLSVDNISISLEIDSSISTDVSNRIKVSVKLFDIEGRYNHKNIKNDAVKLVEKFKMVKAGNYRKMLEEVNGKYKSYSEEMIRNHAFEIDFPEDEFINNRLSKYKIDLLNQLLNYT